MTNSRKVKKLAGLSGCKANPEDMMLAIANSKKSKGVAMIIFSDNVDNGNGESLARFIEKKNLGQITESGQCVNPNSRNTIQAWIWTINWPNLLAFTNGRQPKETVLWNRINIYKYDQHTHLDDQLWIKRNNPG